MKDSKKQHSVAVAVAFTVADLEYTLALYRGQKEYFWQKLPALEVGEDNRSLVAYSVGGPNSEVFCSLPSWGQVYLCTQILLRA